MIKRFKIFEMKDTSFDNMKFNEIKEWEKFVKNLKIKLEPAFENDDVKLLDTILKMYDFDINEYLFHNINPACYKNNMLHQQLESIAIKSRKTDTEPKMKVIKYLIEHNADINMYNQFNETPLLIYLRYSGQQTYGEKTNEKYNIKVVKYLLDNGADPNIAERGETNFQTPLTCCAHHEGADLTKLLIKYGADPYFGKMYNHSQGAYLYTPYRSYFNSSSLDKLVYLIINYNINPFELHKNLLFSGSRYNDGNFFDYFFSYVSTDRKRRHEWIKEVYPELLEYKFQKHLIDNYSIEGVKKVIEIGPNPRIMQEYDEVSIMINSEKYNL